MPDKFDTGPQDRIEPVYSELPYIKQRQDTSCKLIAVLNAFVHKLGKSPIKYPSKEYRFLVELGGGVAGPILNLRVLADVLGVSLLPKPEWMPLDAWIHRCTEDYKNPVMLPIQVPTKTAGYGHAILAVNAEWDTWSGLISVTCVNSQLEGFYHGKRTNIVKISWNHLKRHLDPRSADVPVEVIIRVPHAPSVKRKKKKRKRRGRKV